ncbi:hypothetical protein C1645_814676 [Glomus cerebriforme]|uniref:Uncharacterized protein n=1 Tax=Glomus cerebriforme TaxID=658196 RepID=A0A397TFJ4_9GLOM|nr:hypothetical protein C1645_814676 [Glomus cerebriforme]
MALNSLEYKPDLENFNTEKAAFLKEFKVQYGYGDKIEQIREEEYPQLKGTIFLDHSATTTYAKSALTSFTTDLVNNLYGNQEVDLLLSSKDLQKEEVEKCTRTLKNHLWNASYKFKEAINRLLKGETISNIKIQDGLQCLDLNQMEDSAIWTLLYYAGYLTMNSENHLIIPNYEVYTE